MTTPDKKTTKKEDPELQTLTKIILTWTREANTYVPLDLVNLIIALSRHFSFPSLILKNDFFLMKWLAEVVSTQLGVLSNRLTLKRVFTASEDGFGVKEFHDKCNECRPSMTLIFTEYGHVIGGMTKMNWADREWRPEANLDDVIFLLKGNDKKLGEHKLKNAHLPLLFHVETDASGSVDNRAFGPHFGVDIMIKNHSNTNRDSYSIFPDWFANSRQGIVEPQMAGQKSDLMSGGSHDGEYSRSHFKVIDFEVFQVVIE